MHIFKETDLLGPLLRQHRPFFKRQVGSLFNVLRVTLRQLRLLFGGTDSDWESLVCSFTT